MPINTKDFPNNVETNLKANNTYDKFFINFLKDNKRIRKVLDYSSNNWDKRTRISKAKKTLLDLKNKEQNSGINFNENSTLNQLKEVYMESREQSKWTQELKDIYKIHIESILGKKKIKDIQKVHLDSLVTSLRKEGKSKQNKNGCSPRTIKKVLIETLKPTLQYAVDNNVLEKLPIFPVIKLNRKKKIVENASKKIAILYQTINELYKDDSFYRALFLFALYGRRWNEIRTLNWDSIDFLQNTYTIKAENNKIGQDQTYDLAAPLIKALHEIKNDRRGLVFKSPMTGKELYSPKNQLSRIKEKVNMPELTMHYFRHILVSAMGEMGTANTILSASLGHTNLNTVNDYYLSANHTKASAEANKTLDKLIGN